jgi:hypothetical protein
MTPVDEMNQDSVPRRRIAGIIRSFFALDSSMIALLGYKKAPTIDLGPENAKASTFGTYYLLRDLIVSVGAFGAACLWNKGPGVNFFTAAAFGAAGTIYFAVFGRDLRSAS